MKIVLKALTALLCAVGLVTLDKTLQAPQEVTKKPSIKNRNPNDMLLVLITENNFDLVKYTIEEGNADIAYENYKPVALAVELGRKEILEYFLSLQLINAATRKMLAAKARKNNAIEIAAILDHKIF